MEELDQSTKGTVLDSPAMTYIAPLKIVLDSGERRKHRNIEPHDHVFKRNAPNRVTT